MPYLILTTYRPRTGLPASFVDEVEALYPGWIDTLLDDTSAQMNARLGKRYDVPFQEPHPRALDRWLTAIVDPIVMRKRGVDQTDQQYMDIRDAALDAWKEIAEAADAEKGLFELPLRNDTTKSGIVKPATLSHSEASPWVGHDVLGRRGRYEDSRGEGTYE